MYCSVCQRDTTPLKLTGEEYCSNCGTKYAASPATNAQPAIAQSAGHPAAPASVGPKRMTDLAPRPKAAAAPAVPDSTTPTIAPAPIAVSTVSRPNPAKPATAVHSRVKPSHVIDLRASQPSTPAPTAAPITHHAPAPAPQTTARDRHLAHLSDRLTQAKQIDRSPHISRFANRRADFSGPATAAAGPVAAAPPATPLVTLNSSASAQPMPSHVAAQHQAMARLIAGSPQANPDQAPAQPAPKPKAGWRPHLKLSPRTGQIAATATAVVIMAGYVWVQNYPKLALQAAGDRAGLTASLPSYLPSSYSLARTNTAPGSVTLSFASPSLPDQLKIAQTRTTWDASSLLDNFVIKNTDDYSTVQGQGLTIYLFGQNQATWINHGIWYSIEGATRLSREQILKIAYSL